MLDINLIRTKPDFVKKKIKERGYDIDVDKLTKIDAEWKKEKQNSDKLRAKRNKVSIEISELKKAGKDIKDKLKEAKKIPKELEDLTNKIRELEHQKGNILHSIPNIQDDSVPVGGEEKNKVVKKWGKIPKFKFKVKGHEELLENLNILDMKRAAKIAGSGFYMFKGELAKLERALINYMLDYHTKDGFVEINPPQLVNAKTLFGTGNLPKFEEDVYKTREDMYLIPTAEVPVTNMFANETLSEKDLPQKFVAFTQCYRTEAGTHGSQTPGIFRLHQFEKVEMVYICHPKDSAKFHEEMTKRAEKLLQNLKLPYQRVVLATEDASFASAKTYDLEVHSPFHKKYLEASSCSNCTDFQARRMNTRFIENKTGERKVVHTLNGSGLATPRLLIALIENNQQKDGSIKIPTVLQKYTGFKIMKVPKEEKPKKKVVKKKKKSKK